MATNDNSAPWRVLIGLSIIWQAFPEHLKELEKSRLRKLCQRRRARLQRRRLLEALKGIDAIVTELTNSRQRFISSADRLKTIVKHGVGLETIDLNAA